MLGFECKSLFHSVDAAAASAGVSGKRSARRSHESPSLESEPSVSKKVKRSSSPQWEGNSTFSAVCSLAERQLSASSNASTAVTTTLINANCSDDATSVTTEGECNNNHQEECGEQPQEELKERTPMLATPQRKDTYCNAAAMGNKQKFCAKQADYLEQQLDEEFKRKDSATLEALEETERLVSQRYGRFARPRSATICFGSNSAPSCASACSHWRKGSSVSYADDDLIPESFEECAVVTETTLLEVRCALGHQFDTTLRLLRQGQWCHRCAHSLAKAREHAIQMQGQLLSRIFQKKLQFQCSRGHIFEMSAHDFAQHWCTQCKKDCKHKFKKYFKDLEEKQNEEYGKQQEKLYEEAKQQCAVQQAQKILYAAKVVEKEVEKIAEKQAREYLQRQQVQQGSSNIPYIQALDVYKALLYPDQVLQYYYSSLDAEALKKEFRSRMKSIHPE